MSEVSRRQTAMEEILADAMRRWREDGDFDRLAGKPLDLADTSPEWLTNRLLKNEGFSHPAIEKGRDVDRLLQEADEIADRVRRLAETLAEAESGSARTAVLFDRLIHDYRAKLEEYNRSVLGYNLTVPEALHKRCAHVETRVRDLEREIASGRH